jgi:hypothetical protein
LATSFDPAGQSRRTGDCFAKRLINNLCRKQTITPPRVDLNSKLIAVHLAFFGDEVASFSVG